MARTKNLKTVTERFEDKFIRRSEDDCWEWTAATNAGGYGIFSFNDKCVLAHRFAYQHYLGISLTKDVCLMHICDNPRCVNYVNHLKPGTWTDNVIDRNTKNRQSRGERSRHAKLNEGSVLEIRKLNSEGISEADLSRRFKVAPNTINYILNRRSWKHI